MAAEGPTILTTPKFRVERAMHVAADGRVLRRTIVVHRGAAVILARPTPESVVLVENERVTVRRALLELPAGTLEEGEAPSTCALRELEEETGFLAGSLKPLFSFFPTPGICDEEMHVFLAEDLTKGEQRLEADESMTVHEVSLERALAMVGDGRIVDGKTIAALLHFDRFGGPR